MNGRVADDDLLNEGLTQVCLCEAQTIGHNRASALDHVYIACSVSGTWAFTRPMRRVLTDKWPQLSQIAGKPVISTRPNRMLGSADDLIGDNAQVATQLDLPIRPLCP